MMFQKFWLKSPNKLYIPFAFYFFVIMFRKLCSDYIADLIEKLELFVFNCSLLKLLKIYLGTPN